MLCSCSTASKGPEKGSPAFYWQAARETYAAGDYVKTLDHLDQLLATENEFTSRALPWSLVLMSGMASGHMELADTYTAGARLNKSDPGEFRRQVSLNRGGANRLALRVAENFAKIDKLKADTVPLAFGYPKGTAAQPPQYTKLANGIALSETERDAVQKRALERGVLLAACRAAGAPNDTAKTEQILKNDNAQVSRDVFVAAMAETLFNEAQLYTRDKLDEPQKLEILCQRAQDALKGIPGTKETKALSGKFQEFLKKAKKS
jgi:hypothetical protein